MHRRWQGWLGGFTALLAMVALFTTLPHGEAQVSGTLVYATRVEPACIDPGNQVDQQTLKVVRNAYEALVEEVQGTMRLGPGLAARWEISPGEKVYTFFLRSGVKFADGSPFDAEAVKFSYDRVKTLGLAVNSVLNNIEGVDVVNPSTVRIRLGRPDVYFLNDVAKVSIVSPTTAMRNQQGKDLGNQWLCHNSAGTGPYQLVQWQPNQYVMLRANPTYWRGWNGRHIQQIQMVFIPEPATQLQMLERLEIDMVATAFVDALPQLRQNSGLRVIVGPAIETDIFTMNVTKPPLNDARVRQAISLAFNYNAMAKQVWHGLGRVPRGFLPQGMECFDTALPPMREDLGKARALLQEAGAANAQLTLAFTAGRDDMKQAAAILQDGLRTVGVTLQVQEIPWPTLYNMHKQASTAPNFGTLIMGAFTGDPASFLELNFHSRNIGRPLNWSFWGNSDFDRAVDGARSTLDKDKRCALLDRAQKILVDQAPALYLSNPPKVEPIRARVKGYTPHPIDYYWSTRFYSMWLE